MCIRDVQFYRDARVVLEHHVAGSSVLNPASVNRSTALGV